MEVLNYRDATLEDLSVITSIYNSTIPSRMVTADTEMVSVESRKPWFYAHIPGKRPLWIVEGQENQVIGWVSLQSFYGRPAYDRTAEISIYLAEECRHKGYGKEILRYVIANVPNFGINTLLGVIFAHNEPSLKLFINCGFEEWAYLPCIAILDNQERSVKILGLRISK